MNSINYRQVSSRACVGLGGLGMLVGALDPLEGSALILPGSGLLALGALLEQADRRVIAYRALAFILIALGVGAMWALSAVGGFGGSSGRSNWWALLMLPYLIGWSMGIWGRGSPRWMPWLGIGVGLWYLTILGMILVRTHRAADAPILVLAAIGVLTIGGCLSRLKARGASPPPPKR